MLNHRNLFSTIAFILLCMALVAVPFLACGDDDDDDDSSDDDDDDDSSDDDDDNDSSDDDDDNDSSDDDDDNDTGDDDDNDDSSGSQFVSGAIEDGYAETPLEGVDVEALDDNTLAPFDPQVTGQTDADGNFVLEIPSEKQVLGVVTVKATKSGYQDTYLHSMPVYGSPVAGDANFMFTPSDFSDMASRVGITPDPTKGHVIGFVFYQPDDGEPGLVGCSEVTLSPSSGSVFYFGNMGWPTTQRSNTNPNNGLFIAFNVKPGALELNANTDGKLTSANIASVQANASHFIIVDYTDLQQNPTPSGCSDKGDK